MMRRPFKDAADALLQAGYRTHGFASDAIIYGDDLICVGYAAGGTVTIGYGGRTYMGARTLLRPKSLDNEAAGIALKQAREQRPDLVEIIDSSPRSDAQAQAVLDAAAALGAVVAELYPEARKVIEEKQQQVQDQHRRLKVSLEIDGIARGKLVPEVLRLHDEGLLDDSNAFAGLKAIAESLRGLRQSLEESGDTVSAEPAAPAP